MADVRVSPLVCPIYIGRRGAIDSLRRLLADACAGQGGIAVIAGEAGIGKSRLAAEIRSRAAELCFYTLAGASYPEDSAAPYAPVVDLLRRRLGGMTVAARTAVIGPYTHELSPLLPEMLPLPGPDAAPNADPTRDRRRLFSALAHALLAGFDPGVAPLLVVEDLHWCDDGSLDFLAHLARRVTVPAPADQRPSAPAPALLLTYRAEAAGPRLRALVAQIERERLTTPLALSPLTRDEVAAMLAAIGGRRPPPALVDRVNALAEGNPYCIEEMAPVVLDPKAGPEPQLPPSLRAAVQQRVDRLSPSAREVLTLAAVVGRRFDFALLERLAGVDERTLLTLIKELVTEGLVAEEAPDQFTFRHALTREVVYAGLLTRERQALHRTVAEIAEELYGGAAEAHAADLARHFFAAEAWEKALVFAHRAGSHAQQVYAPRVALEQFSRAIEAAERLERRRDTAFDPPPPSLAPMRLRRLRGRALDMLGDFEGALADYQAALDLARATGAAAEEWQDWVDLGLLWSGRDYARAGACYEAALATARDLNDPALLAHSMNHIGNWRVNAAHPDEALPLHREALAIFERLGDERGIAATLDLLGMAAYLGADLKAALDSFDRATALCRKLDDRAGLVNCLGLLTARGGSYELESLGGDPGALAAAERSGAEGIAIARAIGWRAGEAFVLLGLGSARGVHGRYGPALAAAHEALHIAEEIEHRQWTAGAHTVLCALHLDLFALDAARRHGEQAYELAAAIGSAFWMQMATGLLAQVRLQDGDTAAATTLLASAPVARPGRSIGELWLNGARAALALARGDAAAALRLSAMEGRSLSQDTPGQAMLRAAALAALGWTAEAETLLRAVEDAVERQGLSPRLWRCRAALGDLYRTQARHEDARRAWSSARMVIESIAAELAEPDLRDEFLHGAAAQLPRAYRLTHRRSAAARYAGLTEREREVAALVGQGLSNRAVAQALVLGERTIETHVSNILGKLGVETRAQIAAWARAQGLAKGD
ncbi:MAG: AAA family ATPase [Dehalococcoidia bacterium]